MKEIRRPNTSGTDVIGILMVSCALVCLGFLLLMLWPAKAYTGVRDGVSYSYWQKPGSCRQVQLTYPDGIIVTIYDQNDNNIIGDAGGDYYRISKGESYIRYDSWGVKQNGWHGEVLEKNTALNKATEIFQERRKVALGEEN